MPVKHRPSLHLAAAAGHYPKAWQQADAARSAYDWPDWCFLPTEHALVIVNHDSPHMPPQLKIQDSARLASLASWRTTQGIYRFDHTIYRALAGTPLNAKVPAEVFYYLPERCIYLETPNLGEPGNCLHGCFASIEWSARRQEAALLLVLDSEQALQPILVPMDREDMMAAMRAAIGSKPLAQHAISYIAPIISLLLYLCSTNADLGDFRPLVPKPTKTKKGIRVFPPEQPSVIEVGVRLGGVIRAAQSTASERSGLAPTEKTVAPHIRRAHWHTFWLGKQGEERRPDVRWLHPIPVNMKGGIPNEVTRRRVT